MTSANVLSSLPLKTSASHGMAEAGIVPEGEATPLAAAFTMTSAR